MLVFRTGLQGHGKTLNAIKEIDAKAKSEGRPVTDSLPYEFSW